MAGENEYLLGVRKGNGGLNPVNKQTKSITRSLYYGLVVSNTDEEGGCRISAIIPSIDSGVDQASPKLYASPLLPITINQIPKVGESVVILLSDVSKPYSLRFYIGSVVPAFQNLSDSPYETALSLTNEATTAPPTPVSTIATANGLYPVDDTTKTDVNILGRDNTDILQSQNQVVIRSGKYMSNKPLIRNNYNTAYTRYRMTTNDETSSIANFADYFFNISHNGKNSYPERIVTDDDIEFYKKNTFSTLRAEPTIQFLQMIVNYLCNSHSHEANNVLAADSEDKKKLLAFDLETLFSEYHKIN
jgi:hypothetical protein